MSGLELSEFFMRGAPRRAFEQHDRWHLGAGAHPLRPHYDRRASTARSITAWSRGRLAASTSTGTRAAAGPMTKRVGAATTASSTAADDFRSPAGAVARPRLRTNDRERTGSRSSVGEHLPDGEDRMRNTDTTPAPVESMWPAWAGRWLSRVQLEVCRDLARQRRERGDADCGAPTVRALVRLKLITELRPAMTALTDAGRAVVAAFEAGRACARASDEYVALVRRKLEQVRGENARLREALALANTERDNLLEFIEKNTDPDGMPLGPGAES